MYNEITNIQWAFNSWKYFIEHCTVFDLPTITFPVTPPTGINKTWEVTFTEEELKIKCNTLEVLHFIYNNTLINDDGCTAKVKGKKPVSIVFSKYDTATKGFKSSLVGK